MYVCVIEIREQMDKEQCYSPFIHLYVEDVSSTNSYHSALSGRWQPTSFVGRSHLFGEVFRSDADR